MKQRFIVPMLGAGAVVLALTGSAFACHGGRLSFEELDKDGNGSVTLEEFTAAAQARAAEKFTRLDANSDGVVTKQEMDAARQAFRERHSQRKNSDPAL